MIQSSLVKDPEICFLAEGFGNYNYIAEENGKKFVFRIRLNVDLYTYFIFHNFLLLLK